MQLTDSTANMMISTLNDPEEPFTPELEQTATSVTGCLTNVLKSAAGSSQDDTDSAVTPPSPEVKITTTVTSTTTMEISPFCIHSLTGISFSPSIQDKLILGNRVYIKRTKRRG